MKFFEINELKLSYNSIKHINPLTLPGEVASVFTSVYLSAGSPALGEAKGLIFLRKLILKI